MKTICFGVADIQDSLTKLSSIGSKDSESILVQGTYHVKAWARYTVGCTGGTVITLRRSFSNGTERTLKMEGLISR